MRRRSLASCAALGLVALLTTACTEAYTLGQQQLQDGAAWLDQNHNHRYDYREKTKTAVDFAYNHCLFRAETKQSCLDAIDRATVVIDFLDTNYPDLVTVQILRQGRESLNRLRKDIKDRRLEELDEPLNFGPQ